jgi:hypothetical protein
MSIQCQSINFNIEIDKNTEIYRAIHSFSRKQSEDYFAKSDEVRKANKNNDKVPRSTRDSVKAKLTETLELIVVNLLLNADSYHIGLNAKKNDKWSRYQHDIYRYRYRRKSLDILTELGFITYELGSYAKGLQTTIFTNTLLLTRFKDYGTAAIYRKVNELIVIRDKDKYHHFNAKSFNVEYTDTPQIIELRKEMELINKIIGLHTITYPRLSTGSVTHTGRQRDLEETPLVTPLYANPDYHQLYRVFNNGSVNEGGRMYGASWINIKKKLRYGMLINNLPCTEIDYKSMAVRQLYTRLGRSHSDDYDAYAVPELVKLKINRKAIKRQVQRMLNSKMPLKSFRCKDDVIKQGFKGLDYKFVEDAIVRYHQPISEYFGTGIGLELMNEEAMIMIKILKELHEINIPALPLHDALITQSVHTNKVRELMFKHYADFYNGAHSCTSVKELH